MGLPQTGFRQPPTRTAAHRYRAFLSEQQPNNISSRSLNSFEAESAVFTWLILL